MITIDQARKEFDRLLISKNFNLSDEEVIKKSLELENNLKSQTSHK